VARNDSVTGYIMTSRGTRLTKENSLNAKALEFIRQLPPTRWEEYQFRSHQALRGERQLDLEGPFNYPVLCRRSGDRIIIVSETLDVVDAVLGTERLAPGPPLERVEIDVHGLVEQIVTEPGRYVLSRVDAMVPAYESFLRSVTFYGDDIGRAPLFGENLTTSRLQCYACGLRKVPNRSETLRITNRGVLTFLYPTPQRMHDVERALGYVRELQFFRSA
jgi:hypothetical protein